MASYLDFWVAGATELALSFCSAMMKTWQELARTREKRLATAMFRNVVMDPSLVRFMMTTMGQSIMLRGLVTSGHLSKFCHFK